MLDLKFIRENADLVKAGVRKKNADCDIDAILNLDENRREVIREVEKLKAERNKVSSEIAQKKKAKESADREIAAMREVGQKISALDEKLREVETDLQTALSWVPNLPHEDIQVGGEEDMKILSEWGDKPEFKFEPKPHWELGEKLGMLDLEASARISGSGFYLLKGFGSRLQRALINYMLDVHTTDGFVEINPPYVVLSDTMFGTGQLPKMDDDMYKTEVDGLYLIPTGEVPMTNLYRDQIISESMLPLYLVGFTPCFRREAGAAGKDTRGLLRVHQFDKVELVKIVKPENSYEEFENLNKQAEKIIQGLEIPYRVGQLATGDLTFASTKTYDIEIWAAGVQKYLEVSSVSIFEDFQARRMNCRFRNEDKSVQYPHTMNGSGVALPRLMAAIMENYQNEDGSITVPKAIRPYMQGMEKITDVAKS